ncbi:DNA repair endonuclease XPF [Anastrepha obliqua]|uniref:DNA repair endonuclease XPF n=1 Tax=Anastrepha obliqua TaxID=95512 RepID=UPI00240A8188|nr:DNA repair endonuclease XPF [Anastrepha obliqua]
MESEEKSEAVISNNTECALPCSKQDITTVVGDTGSSAIEAAVSGAEASSKDEAAGFQNDDAELANIMTAEEYLQRKDVQMLAYERQMFLDIVNSDGLIVCAKGLHYDRVLTNVLRVYSDPGNLILVINFSDWEELYYKSKLDKKYVHEVATTATERERVYLEGGIQFISTRILVVDMLKKRIPIELITGIVVMRAHTIIESCQEAFALRLYRMSNKTGFIKAFSSSAEAFTIGYGHIERTMRNLFVKQLFIWPRFHAIVQQSLKPYEAQTVELHVPMSTKMTLIQTHLLDIMNYLVREIKRINRLVDLDEITVENCITKKFHKILQAQLDCIWHQLNSQTKLIVADLKILRNLMISTIYNDAVAAYALTKRYRTTEYALSNSGWTLLDSAEQIFKLSKERVYNAQGEFDPEPCPKWKYLVEILKVEIPGDMKRSHPDCLVPPKVLILCQDTRTCFQLRQFLTQGGERYLLYAAMQHEIPIGKLADNYDKVENVKEIEKVLTQLQNSAAANKINTQKCSGTQKSRIEASSDHSEMTDIDASVTNDELTQLLIGSDGEEQHAPTYFQESYMLTMTQLGDANDTLPTFAELDADADVSGGGAAAINVNTSIFEPFPELENLDMTAAVAARNQPLICIQTFKTEREGAMALDRTLDEIQPQYVIMYHCNVTAIRQLEIFEASQRRAAKDRMRVFFLLHARTVEEQSYLTSLRREKQAFELIIDTKRVMVIPEYQDGKTDEAFILYKTYAETEGLEEANAVSREAGGQASLVPIAAPKIIVDMREFRSDLPCLIHKRGMEVLPVTITIGDYILTPNICVERKSISDLIGSLNSGRLYNQCIQMQRYYAKPILLIEFDQNKPFHLQGKYMLSQNTTSTQSDIVQKLQLLTIHFPKLRLIWSPSPYATAQLFQELKMDKPQPDPKQAAAVGCDESGGSSEELKYNPNIYDFLLRLPGVNTRNVHKLMRNGGSLKELLKRTQAEISEMLDSQENGRMLWDALHVAHLPEKDEVSGAAVLAAGKSYGSHSRFRRGAAAAVAARGAQRRYKK